MLEEFLGTVAMREQIERFLQPAEGAAFLGELLAAMRADRVLVERVRGDAEARDLMHFGGANLKFDALVARTDHGRVDRTIVVLFRRRDVILEAAGDVRPLRMHDAERAIAILHRADDDPKAEDVGQLLEGDRLALHLAPHRKGRLLASGDRRGDAARLELLGEFVLDALDDAAVLRAQIVQSLLDGLMRFRHQMPKGEALEFLAQALHAHAAGERRIDVERLLSDARALLLRDEMQRAHIVQAVGELDEQHAHVFGDGEQQFAEILALPRLLGDEIELFDLGQALDEFADLFAKQPVDLLARGVGVFERIVQNGRDDRRVVELQIGEDRGDFERVGEIRVAGGAGLRPMRLHRVDIGPV